MRVPEGHLDELHDKAVAVATSVFGLLLNLRAKGSEFKKRHNYPSFDGNSSATYRSAAWSDGEGSPVRYQSVFGDEGDYDTLIPYTSIPGAADFVKFVDSLPSLREFLWPARLRDGTFKKSFLTIAAMDLPLEIVQRHIHTVGWDLDPVALETYYAEMSAWWLQETLPVKLMVPILAVDFDTDEMKLDESVELRRLTVGEQLARWPGARLDRHKGLVEMATHALLISGWNLACPDYPGSMFILEPPEHVEQADQFFRALGAVTDAPSGYVQVVTVPVGWANGYTADLPPLQATSLVNNHYSSRLKPNSEPLDVIDRSRLARLKDAYHAQSSQKPVKVAAERLLMAERRASEADRVVDLCIGLEALLGDPKGETTFKIAVRGAAFLAHTGIPNASEFYRALKRIYGFRSAIVHGSSSASRDNVSIAGVAYRSEDIARMVLRRLLSARVSEPSFTPEQIDNTLLTAAIDGLAADIAEDADSVEGGRTNTDWLASLPRVSG
jgi:hypothetical protein